MTKFIASLFLIALLAGCSSTAPAKSKCFSYGRVNCKFTPINQLWGTPDAPINL